MKFLSAISKVKAKSERALDPKSESARRELLQLGAVQSGERVKLTFTVAGCLKPDSVWALYDNSHWIHLAEVVPAAAGQRSGRQLETASYEAELDLASLAGDLPMLISEREGVADGSQDEGPTMSLFIGVSSAAADVPRYSRDIECTERNETLSFAEFLELRDSKVLDDSEPCRSKVRLGRFLKTWVSSFHAVESTGNRIELYVNRRGFLTVALNRVLNPYNAVYIRRLTVAEGVITFRGRIVTRHGQADEAKVVLIGRDTGSRYSASATLKLNKEATSRKFGLREYTFKARLDLRSSSDEQLSRENILDAWLDVRERGGVEPVRTRIGRTRYIARKLSRAGWQRRGGKTLLITPYYTFKAKKTSFHVELLDTEAFEYARSHTRIPLRPQRMPGTKPVWLVGERPYKAQDTGLHFFRYLRLEHPEIEAYYVIDPASPELRNLDGLGNVVAYGSKQHFELALRAERFIGSHHPDFLYPTRMPQFRRAVGGVKVFLQHGVMGTKWMVPNYGKKAPGFDTDLFIVSSEREKEYIVEDFGYSEKDVVVTGLSRFDALFADDVQPKSNQILIIPTWRDWLSSADVFTESEYFHAWNDLLHDEDLRVLAEKHDAEIVFCLHPNMQQYRSYFAGAPARVISQGEVDVQHLLKESAVMVTDYSSVGFDFSFLEKPVHYFQFDRERFLGPKGSHLNLDVELPGSISFDIPTLLRNLESSLESGCVMPQDYLGRSRRFLTYKDRDNSARIFEAVRKAKPAESRIRKLVDPELGERLFGRYRRSRFYFPSMRWFYKAVRKLPMDDELIVFESGIGKQYADLSLIHI